MHARWTLVLCVSTVCCQEFVEIELPEVEDAKAVIVVLQGPDGVEMYAGPGLTQQGETPDERYVVTALYYDEDYDTLQIAPGMLLPAKSGEPTRPLPIPPIETRRTKLDVPAWEVLDEIPADVAMLRIRAFDIETCANTNGCTTDPFADPERLRCTIPCEGAVDVVAPMEPTLPTEPAPPSLRPCPEHFTETVVNGIETCDPPPRPSSSCPDGETVFYGGTECERIGTPCPVGWRTDLPPDAIRVAAGESIAAAIASAPPGATIELDAATFVESVTVATDLRIVGACPEQTRIRGAITIRGAVTVEDLTVSDAEFAVAVRDGSASLTGVRIERADIGIAVLDDAALGADRVLVRETERFGLRAAGSVSIDELRIDDCASNCATFDGASGGVHGLVLTTQRASHGVFNRGGSIAFSNIGIYGPVRLGFGADGSSTSTVTGMVVRDISGAHASAVIAAAAGTTVRLEDVYVANVEDPTNEGSGFGINMVDGASANVTRGRFENVSGIGMHAINEEARIDARDILVHDISGSGHTTGVLISVEAHGVFERVAVFDVSDRPANGFAAHGPDTTIMLDDVRAERVTGHGLLQVATASVTLERAHFERCDQSAATFHGVAHLEDVRIVDDGTVATGSCINTNDEAWLDVSRLHITGCRRHSFIAHASTVQLRDITITDISEAPNTDATVAYGVHAHNDDGDLFLLERAHFERIAGGVVFARGFGQTEVNDVRIRDVDERGIRLDQADGAMIRAIAIERAARFGLVLRSTHGVSARHVSVEGTKLIGEEGGGIFFDSASGSLSSFVSRDNATQGILLQERIGSLTPFGVSGGDVVGNDIGVQYPDTFDVRHLLYNVRLDNTSDELREDS